MPKNHKHVQKMGEKPLKLDVYKCSRLPHLTCAMSSLAGLAILADLVGKGCLASHTGMVVGFLEWFG